MAHAATAPGRLIAVDGTRGTDVHTEAARLADELRGRGVDCAISRWDASGVFDDLLAAAPERRQVSARMLTLLYATDLAFRLRWEIAPALAEGRVVIAAPYVETAVAVGVGLGVPDVWVREVLRFALAPDAWRAAPERRTGKGWRPRADRGFAEYCTALLAVQPAGLRKRRARRTAMTWLDARAEVAGALKRGPLVRLVTGGR